MLVKASSAVGYRPWLGGPIVVILSAVDDPPGPSVVAVHSPVGPSMAAALGLGGPIVGGPLVCDRPRKNNLHL